MNSRNRTPADRAAENMARRDWKRRHRCTGEPETCLCPDHIAARLAAGQQVDIGDLPFE